MKEFAFCVKVFSNCARRRASTHVPYVRRSALTYVDARFDEFNFVILLEKNSINGLQNFYKY
jgi:hypothetical protein